MLLMNQQDLEHKRAECSQWMKKNMELAQKVKELTGKEIFLNLELAKTQEKLGMAKKEVIIAFYITYTVYMLFHMKYFFIIHF